MKTMSPESARTLFLVAAGVLLLQYGIIGLLSLGAGEPWPAVIQPGFKNVWDGNDTVRIPRAELEVTTASGRTLPVPLEQLFDGIPTSHHLGLLRAQFQPASISGTTNTERALSPDTRVWLRQQVDRLFPDEQASLMLAVWREMLFDRASQESTTRVIDTLVIDLDHHAGRTDR